MEHYRSTLAVTALAVFGLVAADRFLHPGTVEARPRGARVVTVTAEAAPGPTMWTNPPLRLHAAEPAAFLADSAAFLSPGLTVALPEGALSVPRLSSVLAPPPVVERKAKADPLGDLIRAIDKKNAG